jgi:cytochrome c oxidase cbb3-type subunit 3
VSDRIIHEYDGIQEADNDLPRWWLWILYGTIVFAGVYWLGYQALRAAPSPVEAYQAEKLEAARAEAVRLKAEGPLTPEKLVAMSQNAAIVREGRALFVATCASCHGPNAGGLVGPNLTDPYWIHGGSPIAVVTSVRKGWLDKGMPAWGPQLGEDRVREVAAYVMAIRNTNVAGGKPPQGEKE